jgi:hypothetical protein
MSGPAPIQSCRRARAALLRALDGELPLEGRLALDAHLATCAACARFEADAAGLEEALRAGPEPTESLTAVADVTADILAALDRALAEEPSAPPAQPRRRWAAAAAAAILLGALGLGVAWWRARTARSPAPHAVVEGALAEVEPPEPAPLDLQAAEPADGGPELEIEGAPDQSEPARIAGTVRENLRAAFGAEPLVLDPAPAVRRFEELSSSIHTWPLARVAESLLGDADAHLAASAARYLGLRGDRLSVPRLAAALARPGVGPAAVLALGDLHGRDPETAGIALEALRAALAEPELAPLARDVLAGRGGPGPARVLEQALRAELTRGAASPGAATSRTELAAWLAALARTGPAAVASLLRLAGEGTPDALGTLARIPGADEELARVLERPLPGVPREVLSDALEILQPARGLAWLEERAGEPRNRARALVCLATWREPAAVGSYLRLDELGTVPEEELLASFRRFAADRGELLVTAAEDLERRGEERAADRYLDLLLVSASPSAGRALVELARSSLLRPAARARAALGVAELGGPAEARTLLRLLEGESLPEREVLAAVLVTASRALAPDELRSALGALTPRGAERVEQALLEVAERPLGPVAIAHVSRALQGALLPRNPETRPWL